MPDQQLVAEYVRRLIDYRSAAAQLVPLLNQMAFGSLRDVLPGAQRLDVEGRINEDWIPTLRIQRVVDERGAILFDVAFGHDDERVEEMIDEVGVEYLDLLLDLTGDDYMGAKEIEGEQA